MKTPIHFKAAVPQFTVPDVVKTAQYWRDVLGFQIDGYWEGHHVTRDAEPAPVFGIVRRGEVEVFFSRADRPGGGGTNRAQVAYDAYLRVTGVEALSAELRARGADILDGPVDRIYGQRELVVKDCNGLVLAFGEET
jgi:catechol 2,3-dioxygenase-like lactoylglutathione lyase family enzyme